MDLVLRELLKENTFLHDATTRLLTDPRMEATSSDGQKIAQVREEVWRRVTKCLSVASNRIKNAQEDVKILFLIDDNMFYRSMRYEYFQLARKCKYCWVPSRAMWMQCVIVQGTHRSARRMRLKSWHLLQTITNLSVVCFICRNFIPSRILSSNIISCNFIYNDNGIFKSWEFYHSCPLPGTSKAFILGRMHKNKQLLIKNKQKLKGTG